jgi:serine/threonine-protein kinase|nr:protein kinase [Kofleriaceae bacterium]
MIGEYRIQGVLGRGGMGAVYEAIHPLIDKRAAIKIIHRELCENHESVARFQQEAKAVNRIGHPNIVDVFGYGATEDGRAYLIMELLVGEALSAWLHADRAPGLSVQSTCDILIEVSHALEAAHGAGVLHRDLKPDNIFLAQARGGQTIVKLLDFGIAKLGVGEGLTQPSIEYTQPGVFVGTPKYIAPEQARGMPLAGSADIYALGAVTFELLAGRAPFVGVDAVELIAKHVTMQAPLPSVFNPTLPAIADALCSQMLDKDPGRRPTIQQVRAMLEQLKLAPPRDPKETQDPARDRATEIIAAPAAPGFAPIVPPAAAAAAAAGLTAAAVIHPGSAPGLTATAAPSVPMTAVPNSSPSLGFPGRLPAGMPLPGSTMQHAVMPSGSKFQTSTANPSYAPSTTGRGAMAIMASPPSAQPRGVPWWAFALAALGVLALGTWMLGHVVDRNDDAGPPGQPGQTTSAPLASPAQPPVVPVTAPVVTPPPAIGASDPTVTPIVAPDASIEVELAPEIDAAIAIDPVAGSAGSAAGSAGPTIDIEPPPSPPTPPVRPIHRPPSHPPATPHHNTPIPPIVTTDTPEPPPSTPATTPPADHEHDKPIKKPGTKKPDDDDAIVSPFKKKSP